MQLYIMRHGIAIERDHPDCPDEPERFLTPEGIERTRQAARGLLALEVEVSTLLSSPYRRAVETAEIAAEVLELPKRTIRKTDALLPSAHPGEILKELRDLKVESAMCFGHAPQLDEIIAYCLGGSGEPTALKKAGVALLEMATLVPPKGQLVWLMTPKALRKMKR